MLRVREANPVVRTEPAEEPRATGYNRPVRAFEPKFMQVGVLTAALQELTPREVRDADPDRAIEDWIAFAQELGVDGIQLSAAIHPDQADVSPEAMLDPVANTLDLRRPFDSTRARRVEDALEATGLVLSDIGYFDNMLHHDPAIRATKHAFMRRVLDAASWLGVKAICGFVGRNQSHSMDENLRDFEEQFIPLLKDVKARGLIYRVEQCPMPGWTSGDSFHNNIAYTPGTWIALHRICEKHGVGDQFRIHYDPSHAILMGQDSRSVFQYLKDSGYHFLIDGFHVKGQVIDGKGIAAWGYGGQTVERGDWLDGARLRGLRIRSTRGRSRRCCRARTAGHGAPRPAGLPSEPHGGLARPSACGARALQLDIAQTHLVVEHEFPKARLQDRERLKPILQGSIGFVRAIDQAAACMFALQHEVLADQGIPAQGTGREPFRS